MNQTLLQGDPLDQIQIDPNKNYLEELVGDGKKFKSPEELAKGKYESDLYVEHLKARLDEMRNDYLRLDTDYKSRAKLEELIDQLKTPQQQLTSNENNHTVNEANTKPAIDYKEVESLVSSKIMEHESSKREQQNFDLVKSKLKERFGNNYQAVLKEQMDSLGLEENFINDLAKKHPQVLFKTLGLDQPVQRESFDSPPRSTSRFTPTTPQKRTWSYYQKMRKEDPRLYHDPRTQVQMHKDATTLGDDFKDGDWDALG